MATIVLVWLSALFCTSFTQDASLRERFGSRLQLSPPPQLYEVYWDVNGDRISFAVLVQTNGWVGFGISPTGLMLNSDVIQGYVDDSTGLIIMNVSIQQIAIIRNFTYNYRMITNALHSLSESGIKPSHCPLYYLYITVHVTYFADSNIDMFCSTSY